MKKNNFKILAILFIAAFSFSSCSSDDSGDSNGITTGNYFPMSVNNKWNYTDNSSTATEAKIIGTTVFGGTTYYEMTDTNDPLSIQNWMVKKGASYYQKAGTTTENQGSITIVIQPYEVRIFRDDLTVGETWNGKASPKVNYSGSSTGSFTADITYEGTITAIGASETLGSVTYNNIIKMEMDVVVNANSQITNIHSEYWFAKDIGLIKETETSTVDNITKTRYLTSYELH